MDSSQNKTLLLTIYMLSMQQSYQSIKQALESVRFRAERLTLKLSFQRLANVFSLICGSSQMPSKHLIIINLKLDL